MGGERGEEKVACWRGSALFGFVVEFEALGRERLV